MPRTLLLEMWRVTLLLPNPDGTLERVLEEVYPDQESGLARLHELRGMIRGIPHAQITCGPRFVERFRLGGG